MNMRVASFVLGVALVGLSLGGCIEGGTGTLLFSNLSLAPGATGTLTLSSAGVTQLNSIQIGPKGAISFNPAVIQVLSVTGLNGFVVFASAVDNVGGKITLASGSTSGPVPDGAILEFQVQAVGAAGASTEVRISQVDFLLKANSEPIKGFSLTPGKVTIQ